MSRSRFALYEGHFDPNDLPRDIGPTRLEWDNGDRRGAFSLLDTHDEPIRRGGRSLVDTGDALLLLDEAGAGARQSAQRTGDFTADLAPGAVREALSSLSDLRALIPLCGGKLRERRAALVDDEGKTHARAAFLRLTSGTHKVTLVEVEALRGYDKASQALWDRIDARAGPALPPADLLARLSPDHRPYVAKPDIPLTRTESAYDVAGDIIGTYLAVARRNEAGVIADLDTEFLHDYRVALRKTRSVVSLFKGVYAAEETAALKAALSDLMAPTGRLRDLDVYLLERDTYFARLPESLHHGLRIMFDAFAAERAAAHRALAARLQGRAYRAEIEALIARFSGAQPIAPGPRADWPAHLYAQRLIWKRYQKVCRIAREIDADTPDAQVHDLRINCKKLRYLIEFFAPLFPSAEVKTVLKPLKRLQDNLGLFNDFSVQQAALRSFMEGRASNAPSRDDLSAAQSIGALIAVLARQQTEERARVMANFAHFDSEGVRDTCRDLFHTPEREDRAP